MKQIDKDALKFWEALKRSVYEETPIDESMSEAEIERHRLYLESHPTEWMKFFFPNYAKAPFAKFHIRAINRIINNPEWYEVLSWSRELAKSTVIMMTIMYLVLTGKRKMILLSSATEDAAKRLLAPYRANFESNRRITQYYGEQRTLGDWEEKCFKTKGGAMFLGIGAGNAPRGLRNESIRPDVLYQDDFDTDEVCRNIDVLDKNWDWWEKAVYPTRSISTPTLVIWAGNIIAEDCCIVRAGKKANNWDIVNIRDENGKNTWPEKNTEEMIDTVLSKISTKAQQGEYFNNPLTEGKIFPNTKWGKVPALSRFPFLVIYADPTTSEAKGTAKNKKGSQKAMFLLGKLDSTLYVIKGFLGKMTTAEFISHYFTLHTLARMKSGKAVYLYQENNSLQDPVFQQVFKPAIAQERRRTGINLSVTPDARNKGDKATRIEAHLEPMNREGLLVLNIAEKDDPNMKLLDDEFKYFTMAMNFHADGIDCVEGGNWIIDQKTAELQPSSYISYKALAHRSKNRQ